MNVIFDVAQIITIASVGLVVAGWFVNQWLNRRNEILKMRMEYFIQQAHFRPAKMDYEARIFLMRNLGLIEGKLCSKKAYICAPKSKK